LRRLQRRARRRLRGEHPDRRHELRALRRRLRRRTEVPARRVRQVRTARRYGRALAGLLLLALALAPAAGCSSRSAGAENRSAAAGPDGQSQRPIEMFSWWESAGDGGVLGALIKQHQKAYPGDVIINAATGLSGLARKTLRTRMMQREPPDAFQANVGADTMQWVLINRSDARESKLVALDDILPEVAEWRRVLPARL